MEVAQQTEKVLEEPRPLSRQPKIQGRKKMKASKRKTTKKDLKSNLLGGRERAKGRGPSTETLNVDIVNPDLRFPRSKAGRTQQTSRRRRGRGRRKAQVNLGDSRSTPIMPTEDGTLEDSGADVGALVDDIFQILVRSLVLGHAMLADVFVLYYLDFS